jgi:hypothetical protein
MMKTKNKHKRSVNISAEIAIMIIILLVVVEFRVTAMNGPDIRRIETGSRIVNQQATLNGYTSQVGITAFDLQIRIQTSGMEDIMYKSVLESLYTRNKSAWTKLQDLSTGNHDPSKLNTYIPIYRTFELSSYAFRNGIIEKEKIKSLKSMKQGMTAERILPMSNISAWSLLAFDAYTDSIPRISEPRIHKNLAPLLRFGIQKP